MEFSQSFATEEACHDKSIKSNWLKSFAAPAGILQPGTQKEASAGAEIEIDKCLLLQDQFSITPESRCRCDFESFSLLNHKILGLRESTG